MARALGSIVFRVKASGITGFRVRALRTMRLGFRAWLEG